VTEAEIYQILSGIFEDVFLRPVALNPRLRAADVDGWDSFRQVEILIGVEERFGTRLSSREIDSLKDVGDLITVLALRLC